MELLPCQLETPAERTNAGVHNPLHHFELAQFLEHAAWFLWGCLLTARILFAPIDLEVQVGHCLIEATLEDQCLQSLVQGPEFLSHPQIGILAEFGVEPSDYAGHLDEQEVVRKEGPVLGTLGAEVLVDVEAQVFLELHDEEILGRGP